MAIDINRFNQLKDASAKAKTEADRAAGALEEQMKKLKTDFNVDSIEQAEALYADLTKQEKEAEANYNRELADFEAKWADKLKV